MLPVDFRWAHILGITIISLNIYEKDRRDGNKKSVYKHK
jgi:hypothetical protein